MTQSLRGDGEAAFDPAQPPIEFYPLNREDFVYPPERDSSADPLAKLRELRQHCPVARLGGEERPAFTLFSRYDDCSRIYRDSARFSSVIGNRPTAEGHLHVAPEKMRLVELDDPAHRPVRRIMLTAVSPAAVAAHREEIDGVSRATVAAFIPRGSADLVTEWAEPIPSAVIAQMIGVPVADRKKFFDWTKDWVTRLAQNPTLVPGDGISPEFFDYLQGQIDERRAAGDPPDDIFTRMLNLRGEGGEALTDQEIKIETVFLLLAGNETTSNLMGSLIYRILTEPGLYQRVTSDRAILPDLMEETLRFDPPITFSTRYCMQKAEIGGVLVEPGEVVYLSVTSANRDEKVWGADADAYQPDRARTVKHLAFGVGPHVCLGSHLARQITLAGITALLDACSSLQIQPGYTFEHRDYYQLHGPKHLPVSFESSATPGSERKETA
jgi:cytochrome P450